MAQDDRVKRRRRGRIRDETTEFVGAGHVDTVVETSEDVATAVTKSEIPGSAPSAVVHPPETQRSEKYLKSLFWLLIAATFFEGYDSAILALVLPDIQDTFGVSESALGVSRAFIELGLFFAFFLARLGDKIGRRPLLLWSVFGYTAFTALTALSWDLWSFTFFQSASRVFLGAEYAVAITMIVEEFPVHRRASALGRLLMNAAAGALAVAVLLLVGVASGPLEWRTLYLIGIIPLLVLGWYRRRVKETRRFQEYKAKLESGASVRRVSFWEPWQPQYRRNLLLAGLVHLLRSVPLYASTAWFFFFAQREAGIDPAFLYAIFIVAYGLGIGGYAACGFLMERIGRRPTAILYGTGGVVFPFLLFQSTSAPLVGIFLVIGVFFGLGQAPLYGAIGTELFPTHIRNQTMAWSRNVFEIAGFILGPLLVGVLGDHYSGVFGSIGDTVSFLFFLGIPGIWLVLRYLPETRGKELEEIEAEVSGLGLDPLEVTDEEPVVDRRARRAETQRRVVGAVAATVALFGIVAGGLRWADDQVRRPEGAAERFLQAVSKEEDDRIETYAWRSGDVFADSLREFTREDESDDWFERIEVGRRVEGESDDTTAFVPFHVVQQDGDDTDVWGFLELTAQAGDEPRDWHVTGINNTVSPVDTDVEPLVPSGGGPPPASAGNNVWLLGLGVALGLAVFFEGLLRVAGRGTPGTGHPASNESTILD